MRTQLILVAVSFLLASCGVNSWLSSFSPYKMEIRQGNLVTPEMRERLRVGMSRQQVSTALGSPLVADVYHANRWDYIYRYEEKGRLVEQRRLTVYFDGNFVARIEDGETLPQKEAVAPAPKAASSDSAQ
jgi:outer membrane protein assembly factor BamE